MRPKYLPTNGTSTIVNNNSNCSILSLHSSSASDSEYPSSDRVSRSDSDADSDGNEAISSSDPVEDS